MRRISPPRIFLILLLMMPLTLFSGYGFPQSGKEETKKVEETYNLVELRLTGSYKEAPLLYEGLSTDQKTIRDMLKLLKKAGEDEDVHGLFLEVGTLDIGLAKIQELMEGLERFKKTGKKIYGYNDMFLLNNYLLMTPADKICMPPTGMMIIPGLHAEITFFKNLLAKLGIAADLEHVGDYKSASDMFTRDTMSEAQREVVNSILDETFEYILTTISENRGISREAVSRAVDSAIFSGTEAKELQLVDYTMYRDQLIKQIKEEAGKKAKLMKDYGKDKKKSDLSSMAGLLAFFSSLGKKKEEPDTDVPRIALLYASGTIVSGENQESPLTGSIMGDRTITEALQDARKDEKVKAVVIRIDSPGGSGLASDMIWREVVLTRKVKPVIVSMSDVAASGGYYIAMAADTIVAQPGTITGSIGVIGGKFSMGGLYEKIGMDVEVVDRGKNASLFASNSMFSESEREVVRKFIRDFYRDFVTKAASGRKMTYEDLEQYAQGRVWTGTQAKEIGLVDELGGMHRALDIAREKAGLKEDDKYALVIYPKQKPFFEYLEKMFSGGFSPALSLDSFMLSPGLGNEALMYLETVKRLQGERIFCLMPYSLRFAY